MTFDFIAPSEGASFELSEKHKSSPIGQPQTKVTAI